VARVIVHSVADFAACGTTDGQKGLARACLKAESVQHLMNMPRTTIRDVSRVAGVALGTVSRVINGHPGVEPATRKRVEAAIAQLDYAPHQLAQSMRRGSTRTVGIMVRDITVPAFASFVRAAQETLQQAGYMLLITCSENQRDRELEILHLLHRRRVDGLIMNTAIDDDPELIATRSAMGLPIVMLDRKGIPPADSVRLAHCEGMRLAVDYLFTLGHRRIGLITGNADVYAGSERIRGYTEAHQAHGIPIEAPLLQAGDFSGESAFRGAMTLLTQTSPPTALIAGGIALLEGTLRAIRARKLRIPEDISLIGNADTELAQLSLPPVTVVRWDYAQLGAASARLLLDRFASLAHLPPREIIQPSELVVRESCRPVFSVPR
jgi:LacI family transcriptional regulator